MKVEYKLLMQYILCTYVHIGLFYWCLFAVATMSQKSNDFAVLYEI